MIRKSGHRFSEKIMLHQNVRASIDSTRNDCALVGSSGRDGSDDPHIPSAFLRLSHSLQYCGHFIPAGIFPAALSAFQSAPQARSRATMAWRPEDGFASPAGAVVSFFGGGVAAVAGGASPDMHCLLKSR